MRGAITEDLLRRRAEHNDGMLNRLQEISLAGQSIERVALLNQLCRQLRVLHLQNNLLCRVEGLNRLKVRVRGLWNGAALAQLAAQHHPSISPVLLHLPFPSWQDLHTLNLAVNNLARVDGLDRCESLARLDLTLNFIGVAGLATLTSLAGNELLRELTLVGNPCTSWPEYRPYVLAVLPQLTRLDGQGVTADERADAIVRLPQLRVELKAAAAAEEAALTDGGPEALGRSARPDVPLLVDMENIPETGCTDKNGQLRRPWCPATRMLEHREQATTAAQATGLRRRGQEGRTLEDASRGGGSVASVRPPLAELPPLSEGEPLCQRNDGDWEFSLDESADGRMIVLEVDVGRFLDTSLIKPDVQPRHVRLLIKVLCAFACQQQVASTWLPSVRIMHPTTPCIVSLSAVGSPVGPDAAL